MLYIVFDIFGVENMYIQEKDCYIIKNSFVLVSIEMHSFMFPGSLRIFETYSKTFIFEPFDTKQILI